MVIAIDAGSVSAGLASIVGGKAPTLSAVTHQALTSTHTTALTQALGQVLSKVTKTSKGDIHHVLVTFTSPWADTQVVLDERESKQDFTFDHKLKDFMLAEAEKHFKSKKQFIEVGILGLALNGYPASTDYKKKVRRVEADILMSGVDSALLESVEQEVGRVLGSKRGICYKSFTSVFFQTLPGVVKDSGTTLLVSMSGRVSEVAVLKNGRLMSVMALPFGPGTLVESLESTLQVPREVAVSYISLSTQGVLQDETARKVEESIESREEEWHKVWQSEESLMHADKIVFLSSPDMEPVCRTLLIGLSAKIRVHSLGQDKLLSQMLGKAGVSSVSTDESLALLALYSHSLL